MTENERLSRSYDFFSTLPTELQNQIAMQNKLTAENKAPLTPIVDRYRFSKWYE